MEEILASIRRIISEDDAPPAAAAAPEPEPEAAPVHAPGPPPAPVAAAPPPPPLPPEEDVLELTEPVEPTPARPEPAKPQKYEETLGDLDVFSIGAGAPAPAAPS